MPVLSRHNERPLSVPLTLGLGAVSLLLAACGGGSSATSAPAPVVVTPPSPPVVTAAPERPPVPSAAPEGPDFHPAGKGWALTWSDEFDGAALDSDKWNSVTECWGGGNDEKQCYTDRADNVELINGLLRIVALDENFTGPNNAGDQSQRTQPYTSGKVLTQGLANWRYGRIELRGKLPEGQGTWPAFWMLGGSGVYGDTWPLYGEIDIMEAVNLGARCDECTGTDGENRTTSALHFGNNFPDNRSTGDSTTLTNQANPADNYHVWAVEWGEGLIKWFLDGALYSTKTNDQWFTSAAPDNVNAPFDESFYLILNLAIGGNYPEPLNETGIAESSLPNQLLVDWVRVYQCEEDMETGLACME